MQDEALLSSVPDFFQFGTMLKATPASEGGARIIYVEASKESVDQQGEIVLQKALRDSADIFKKFGVLDLDHKSMPTIAKAYGIEHPDDWILGQPLAVTFKDDTTIVKAQLREGNTPLAERANRVWDGMTKLNPPDRYYASVGGSVLGREIRLDPETGNKVPVITKTRWNNLALSLTPVHAGLSQASTVPSGVFAKSLGGYVISKALEASYATDATAKTGGAALATQSLDGAPHSYYDFRERMAAAMKSGQVRQPSMERMIDYATRTFNLSADEAAEWVDRFLSDLKSSLTNRSKR